VATRINTRQKKLLIVDDDADILVTFKRGLQKHGYFADTYQDPEAALKNFRPGQYDLMLVDIHMPKMDGFKFFKEVQKLEPAAKACFVTAYDTYFEAFREIFPDLDIGRYIKKPITIDELAKQINLALDAAGK
jgi:two-component system, OmpR family, response regulator ChvI